MRQTKFGFGDVVQQACNLLGRVADRAAAILKKSGKTAIYIDRIGQAAGIDGQSL